MQSSESLLKQFLGARESAWISVKQANWLVSVIQRERREQVRHRRYLVSSYEINIAPNGAALVKPSGAAQSGAEFDAKAERSHKARVAQQSQVISFAEMRTTVRALRDAGQFDEANRISDAWVEANQ